MSKNKTICPKIGIKIHETQPSLTQPSLTQPSLTQPSLNYNKKQNIDFYNTSLNQLDLDLNNYSLEDIYRLFNIYEKILDEDTLKAAKQIVHKMHPDKSKLESKYFLFFSKAYKKLYEVYQFQNKSLKKKFETEDYYDESNAHILNNMFEKNKDLKDSKNFNVWFNKQFEKNKLDDDENENGYGEWLKSDEGIYSINENVTKTNMNEIFEKQKKQIQSVTVYNGVTDLMSYSSFGTNLMGDDINNFGNVGNGGFMDGNLGYTDLKQAHIETVIPVTQEDYDNIPKYNNVNEYKANRDKIDITPISKNDAERILMKNQNSLEQQSAALAFKYAQQLEKSKEKQQSFWSEIKQLTGW
jgi:hypothetical protein